MSRSYKKNSHYSAGKIRSAKRFANKKVRNKKFEIDCPFSSYKKLYSSYNIVDYKETGVSFEQYWFETKRKWYTEGYKSEPFPNKKKIYKEWYLTYKRK